MHGPLDVITPDELIIGHGRGNHTGVLLNHQDLPYRGESKATSLALSWDIPSFQDPALTREERRALRDENYAADLAVAAIEEEAGAMRPVPDWFPWVIGGGLLARLECGLIG